MQLNEDECWFGMSPDRSRRRGLGRVSEHQRPFLDCLPPSLGGISVKQITLSNNDVGFSLPLPWQSILHQLRWDSNWKLGSDILKGGRTPAGRLGDRLRAFAVKLEEDAEKHIEGLESPCNFCGQIMRSCTAIRQHGRSKYSVPFCHASCHDKH